MPELIPPEKEQRLIADLLNSRYDVAELAKAHELPLEVLAAWILEPGTHRCLASVRLLSEVQAQMYASRWRLTAASTLTDMVQDKKEELNPDQKRRACVDLLRAEKYEAEAVSDEDYDDDPEPPTRAALYGEDETGEEQ